MTSAHDEKTLNRLEDFIDVARKGQKVGLAIDLRKSLFRQKVHPEETDDMTVEQDMYFLIGDFKFNVPGKIATIPKVYVLGSLGESPTESQVNRQVANERLKMDYHRIKNAGIAFEEKYF